MSGSPLQRVLPNAYDDKISFPRTIAKSGGETDLLEEERKFSKINEKKLS